MTEAWEIETALRGFTRRRSRGRLPIVCSRTGTGGVAVGAWCESPRDAGNRRPRSCRGPCSSRRTTGSAFRSDLPGHPSGRRWIVVATAPMVVETRQSTDQKCVCPQGVASCVLRRVFPDPPRVHARGVRAEPKEREPTDRRQPAPQARRERPYRAFRRGLYVAPTTGARAPMVDAFLVATRISTSCSESP